MKLFFSSGSPYARIARVAVRESGLLHVTAEILVTTRNSDNPVLEFSAVGRVPSLVDGEITVTEAKRIDEYLFSKSDQTTIPYRYADGWQQIYQEGQILGYLEGIVAWVRENRREPTLRSSFLLGVELERANRCLAYLENQADQKRLADIPVYRSVALATALCLLEFHDLQKNWRRFHPALAKWFRRQESRPSMRETIPH